MNEMIKEACLELMHHGVQGMHWGVRRYQPYGQGYNADHKGRFIGKSSGEQTGGRYRNKYKKGEAMDTKVKGDSSVTRKVKRDYNDLGDKEFASRYHVDKNTYRKRVNRYGDPYMHSPLAKIGKKMAANKRVQKGTSKRLNRELTKYEKKLDKLQKMREDDTQRAKIAEYENKGRRAIETVQNDGYRVRFNESNGRYEVYR